MMETAEVNVEVNDKFVDLVQIRKYIARCDADKLSKILSLLPNIIDLNIVQSVLFCGLHQCLPQIASENMQSLKNNIDQVLNEITVDTEISPISPTNSICFNSDSIQNVKLSIFDLADDVLVYLCQFLDIFTVLNVEKTCRFFVSIARNPLSCYQFTMDNIDNDSDEMEVMNLSLSPIQLNDDTVTNYQCIPSSRYSSYSFSTSINFKVFVDKYLNNKYYLNQLINRYYNIKSLIINAEHFKSTNDLKSYGKLIHTFNNLDYLKITFSKNIDNQRQKDLLILKGLPKLQNLITFHVINKFNSQMIRKLKANKTNLERLIIEDIDINKSIIDYISNQNDISHFEWNNNLIEYQLHTLYQQRNDNEHNNNNNNNDDDDAEYDDDDDDDNEEIEYYDDDRFEILNNFFNIWCKTRNKNVFYFKCCIQFNQFTDFFNELIENLSSNLFAFNFKIEGDDEFTYNQRMNDMANIQHQMNDLPKLCLVDSNKDAEDWEVETSFFPQSFNADFGNLRRLILSFPLRYYHSIESILCQIPNINIFDSLRMSLSIDSTYDHNQDNNRNEQIEYGFAEILFKSFNKLKSMNKNINNSFYLRLKGLSPLQDIIILFKQIIEQFKGIRNGKYNVVKVNIPKRNGNKLSNKPRLIPKQTRSIPLSLDEQNEEKINYSSTNIVKHKGYIKKWIIYKEIFGNNMMNYNDINHCFKFYDVLYQYFDIKNGQCNFVEIEKIGIIIKMSQKIDASVIKRKFNQKISIKISNDGYYIMFGDVDSYQHW